MSKGERTRARMVETATRLIERQGYAATGISQVLAESGSPKGSMYFHFPGGKEELALKVVENHAVAFSELLEAVIEQTPTAVAAAELSIEGLAQQLVGSDCATGCPVATLALEMSAMSEPLRLATRDAFEAWTTLIAARLVDDGFSVEAAGSRARSLLCAIEGALIMGRAYGSRQPLDDVKAILPHLLAP